jgi:hypothetical protein
MVHQPTVDSLMVHQPTVDSLMVHQPTVDSPMVHQPTVTTNSPSSAGPCPSRLRSSPLLVRVYLFWCDSTDGTCTSVNDCVQGSLS